MEMCENFEIEFERLFVMYSKRIHACFAISQKTLKVVFGQQTSWLFTEQKRAIKMKRCFSFICIS